MLERRLSVVGLLFARIEVGNLLYFVPVLVYFGLAICAATSSIVVLAADAEVPWAWWASLFPLAISHATSGLLAFWKDARSHHEPLVWGTLSGMTTVLAVVVAVWIAQQIGLWMPRPVAVMTLAVAFGAGLMGLALAAKRGRKRHDAAYSSAIQASAAIILPPHKC